MTQIKILALSGTASSDTFLHRVKYATRGYIDLEVTKLQEATEVMSPAAKTPKLLISVYTLIGNLINIIGLGYFGLISSFHALRTGKTSESLTPLARWLHFTVGLNVANTLGGKLSPIEKILLKATSWSAPIPSLRIFFRQYRALSLLLNQGNYDALLLPGENILLGSPLIITAAREFKVPVIVYDFTSEAESGWLNVFTSLTTFRAKMKNFIAVKSWPAYRKEVGGKLFSLPVSAQALAEVLNMRPQVPWSVCGGFADHYIATRQLEYDFYADYCGIARKKIHKAESVELSVARQIRSAPELLTPSKILLIMLPPDQFGGDEKGINSKFNNWIDVAKAFVDSSTTCIAKSVEVVVALHPRTEMYRDTLQAQFPRVRIHVGDTVKVMAQAEWIISGGSGLDVVAIDLGLPLLIWNVYGYERERSLTELHSVLTCSAGENLEEYVKKLISMGPSQSPNLPQSESLGSVLRSLV